MKMFADDTKIWKKIAKDNDSTSLQEDLDKLVTLSQYWQLKFNPDKCKVMHLGHRCKTSYYMSDNGLQKQMEEICEEKDLRIFVTSDLKPNTQCFRAA